MGGWSWIVRSHLDDPVVSLPLAPAGKTPPVALPSAPLAPATPRTTSSELDLPDPDGWTAPAAAASPELVDTAPPPIARLRRNLAVVSGGLAKRTDSAGFVDLFAGRLDLTEAHPVLALLLASFSSEDEEASVLWRIAIDGESGAGSVIGRTVASKAQASRKPKSLTVYGASRALDPGEHTVRIQASSDRPTSVSIRPAVSGGAESLRLIVFELL